MPTSEGQTVSLSLPGTNSMLLRRNTGQRFVECAGLLSIAAEQAIKLARSFQLPRVVIPADRLPIDEGPKIVSNHYCPKDLPTGALWCFLSAAVLSVEVERERKQLRYRSLDKALP